MGKNRLAVHHHVQYAGCGEAHLGRETQLVPDFPLEAPGLQQNADSGEATLDLDGHDSSLSGQRLTALENETHELVIRDADRARLRTADLTRSPFAPTPCSLFV